MEIEGKFVLKCGKFDTTFAVPVNQFFDINLTLNRIYTSLFFIHSSAIFLANTS